MKRNVPAVSREPKEEELQFTGRKESLEVFEQGNTMTATLYED